MVQRREQMVQRRESVLWDHLKNGLVVIKMNAEEKAENKLSINVYLLNRYLIYVVTIL